MGARRILRGLAFLAPIPLLAFAAPLAAGEASTASGSINVTIVEPIAIQAVDPLQFGILAVSPSQGGEVTVDPGTGATSFTGGVDGACPSGSGCFARPALFAVTGEAGRRYRIDAPTSAVASGGTGGGATLTVSAISVFASSGSPSSSRGLLDDAGRDSFRVGGTLSVPAGTRPGIYRAELAVVVSYD